MRISPIAGIIAVAATSVLLLSACTSSATSGGATEDELVGTWVTGEDYANPIEPFLTINKDGTWSGSDGCNGVDGTWELASDGTLTTEAGPSTLMFCEGAALPTFFANTKKAELSDGTLTLLDADDATLVELIAGTPPSSTTSPDGAESAAGRWGEADGGADDKPYLELSADGNISGTDGCNRLMGSWTFDGSTVSFGQLASTKMACQDVDTWLVGAASATVDGDTLELFDAEGQQIGTLARS